MTAAVPLVYLPGSLCDGRVFTEQLRDVNDGHSGATSQVADLTLDDSFAAMTARVLNEAPPEFVLIALSMGCIVAAEIAHVAPERVIGMALFDFNLDAPDETQNNNRRRWAAEVRSGNFAAVVAEIAPAMSIAPEVHGPLIADMAAAVGPEGFLRQNDALLDRYDRRPIVSSFEGPLLIGCGQHDPLCPPPLHTELAATVPHATLAIVEGAGHLSTLDQPQLVTSAIQSLLHKCNDQQPRRGDRNEQYT